MPSVIVLKMGALPQTPRYL